ncbi:MAG: iron chelate uptake ABC transporter family permease subunit, partial [Ilumatobacteraceae bacterium]
MLLTHPRSVVVSVALAVATVVVFCVSISVGDFPVPLRDVVPAVFGFGSSDSDFVIRQLRLPRALAAVVVGAAFGFSGAIFQALAR